MGAEILAGAIHRELAISSLAENSFRLSNPPHVQRLRPLAKQR